MTRCVEATPFELGAPPALSRSTVDRQEPLRDDTAHLGELWREGRLVVVDPKGRAPARERPGAVGLEFRSAAEFAPEFDPATAVFLGEQDGAGFWAVRTDQEHPDWPELRFGGHLLDDTGAGLLTTAVGLLNWHEHSRFCAVCGARTEAARAGWARVCTGCGREEYPRTDPAVICLVHDDDGVNGSRVVLARQPSWPPRRYSVLAGFVEVGESLEATVRREVAEEVGISVRAVRYLGSQPWPFPRSLMVGFAAVTDRDAPLHPAAGEIEDARWFTRDEVRAAMHHPTSSDLRLPMGSSIAWRMLESWVAAS
ncbi:NAD(+) diphosphatase [Gandjariella thermophila]|uniref:NAD(+) diphosphatase n=1 Tax=Gandjariella thermophila TaxID=1931992 RepID=A0A4D4J8G9_9PSEU|nr:NAD(+) diphosphatase [Gandjariella thermophila]GDY33105.1 NADH pyrophosphatase [Gandjariella thermophila]